MMQEASEQFKRIDPADSPRWCRDRNFPCPPAPFHEHSRTMKKPLGVRLASFIPGSARILECPLGRHPCRQAELRARMPAEPAGKMPALSVLGAWPQLASDFLACSITF